MIRSLFDSSRQRSGSTSHSEHRILSSSRLDHNSDFVFGALRLDPTTPHMQREDEHMANRCAKSRSKHRTLSTSRFDYNFDAVRERLFDAIPRLVRREHCFDVVPMPCHV
mmetsp:Transcript_130316/g.416814  ORF Transcript_130316/g.416814 Transcript_130316/m.416814 type:complete len:110 (+) Transcript_130316:144-473(+)